MGDSEHRASATDLRRLVGVLAPLAFITSWVVAGLVRDGYDPIHHAISRLAELNGPNRWIVTTGMLAFGVGAVLFAPLLAPRSSAAFLALAGIASFGVALFPCSSGCPGPGETTDTGHALAAGSLYVAFVLAALLHGRWGRAVAVVAGTCLALHLAGVGPNGLLQRAGLTLLDVWMVVVAVRQSAYLGAQSEVDPRADQS